MHTQRQFYGNTHFNPRTRVGCDRLRKIPFRNFVISIHAPAWGATHVQPAVQAPSAYFNPRTRVGCDDCSTAALSSSVYFNPRTRVGCDTLAEDGYYTLSDFNPRTRVGCDLQLVRNVEHEPLISIHAPAWGATTFSWRYSASCMISIHAPAWGATGKYSMQLTLAFSFQSTHPRGVRRHPVKMPLRASKFQSTHPRGVRPSHGRRITIRCHFNPRTRVGCDGIKINVRVTEVTISIHAPAWGATFEHGIKHGRRCFISIHAPAWGATVLYGYGTYKGAFQSTHPRGVRPDQDCTVASKMKISIHAPAWGATICY